YWQWELRASPEALWPLVANTDRFNFDVGLPTIEHLPGDGRLHNRRRRLGFFSRGMAVDWEEEPVDWVRPYPFAVLRRYHHAPFAQIRTQVDLTPQPDGGTYLVYQLWATPRNMLGFLAIPITIGRSTFRSFDAVFRMYDDMAVSGRLPLDLPGEASFA